MKYPFKIFLISFIAHQECYEYKTLSYSDRREDANAKDKTFSGCDEHLSTIVWYRVVDSAGRQIANSCIDRKSSCSTQYMGWINGRLPSVEDGVVKRQLCFASGDKCCVNTVTIKIRNCKEYFVYQFPRKVATCPSKYCTVYKQGGYTGSRIKLCFVVTIQSKHVVLLICSMRLTCLLRIESSNRCFYREILK